MTLHLVDPEHPARRLCWRRSPASPGAIYVGVQSEGEFLLELAAGRGCQDCADERGLADERGGQLGLRLPIVAPRTYTQTPLTA